MPKITIKQKNLTLDAPQGENLMSFLQSKGIPVASSCLGDGICGKCRMSIVGALPAPSTLEAETLKRNRAPEGQRLACQIIIENDMAIETSYW